MNDDPRISESPGLASSDDDAEATRPEDRGAAAAAAEAAPPDVPVTPPSDEAAPSGSVVAAARRPDEAAVDPAPGSEAAPAREATTTGADSTAGAPPPADGLEREPAATERAARPVHEAAPRPAPARPQGRVVPLLAGALVFTTLLAAVFGVLYLTNTQVDPEDVGAFLDDRSTSAAKTATNVATLLMNYDAANLDEVASELIDLSTGNFKEDYEDVLTGGLGDALEEAAASSRGQILDGPDVYFASADEAVALLRLEQTTQSSENPGGQRYIYLMKMTLVDTTNGGWKADRVEILSQEAV